MSYDPFIVGYFYTRIRMNMRPEVANKMKQKFLLCDLKLELQEQSNDLYHLFNSPIQQLNAFYNFLETLPEDIPIHNEEFFEGIIANSIIIT